MKICLRVDTIMYACSIRSSKATRHVAVSILDPEVELIIFPLAKMSVKDVPRSHVSAV